MKKTNKKLSWLTKVFLIVVIFWSRLWTVLPSLLESFTLHCHIFQNLVTVILLNRLESICSLCFLIEMTTTFSWVWNSHFLHSLFQIPFLYQSEIHVLLIPPFCIFWVLFWSFHSFVHSTNMKWIFFHVYRCHSRSAEYLSNKNKKPILMELKFYMR